MTLGDAPEAQVFAWILGWGARARVIFPAALRRRVASEAARMAMQYADTKGMHPGPSTLF